MSPSKRTNKTSASRRRSSAQPARAAGSRPSSPLLNQSQVRGLLGPGQGAAAPNADNRGMLSFLDQWGGIDGIMSTMTKVQKMIRMFQQFGPIFNMFGSFGSFLGGKATTASLPPARRPNPSGSRNRTVGKAPRRPSGFKSH